jgi:hypothetical protein
MRSLFSFALSFLLLTASQLAVIAQEGASPAPTPVPPLAALSAWLQQPPDGRPVIADAPFARVALSRADAERAAQLLWEDHAAKIRATRTPEMMAKVIVLDGLRMRFEMMSFGDSSPVPTGGRSLFLSMHGGGGAPTAVNDSQWKNQIRLGRGYAPKEGIYLAPRAPSDTWDLWHQAHIDRFFARLIENLVVLNQVNPDRVYLMGYSAGGDGAYQVGPRMADRWAAVAMMAGHPNEASPLGLRNLPFAIQVGANDSAYKRNTVAAEWGRKLDDLQKSDPAGYIHFTELHAGKGHWMDLDDRKAIPWMEKYSRNPIPEKVVWRQDDVTHDQFYWLAVDAGSAKAEQEIEAERKGNEITVRAKGIGNVRIRLNDAMLNLDQPVTIRSGDTVLFQGKCDRTILNLMQTLQEKGDPRLMFGAEAKVKLP